MSCLVMSYWNITVGGDNVPVGIGICLFEAAIRLSYMYKVSTNFEFMNS